MRKEVFLAIIFGFGLGLVITFGAWSANKALKIQQEKQTSNTVAFNEPTSEKIPESSALTLTVLKPENESIIKTEKTVVSGSTLPNLTVVILWEKSEIITKADNEGNFDIEITLIPGINEITVKAFSENGDEISKTVSTVFSTENI